MKKNQKIIVGNWKMNPLKTTDAQIIVTGIQKAVSKYTKPLVVLCPPYIYTSEVSAKLKKSKSKNGILLGVQNIFSEVKGSYTGEISAEMLSQYGIKYVIIGHSERRKMGETDEDVNKKVQLALKLKLIPIICIGESTRDEDGQYLTFIKQQVEASLKGVDHKLLPKIIIAYEPVWAIGAKEAMNPHQVHEMMIFIKKTLVEFYRIKSASVATLYGGSVDALNAEGILKDGQADGLLIGRQSLDPMSFGQILASAHNL